MRAIDLFAGAGGFSEGAKQAGVQVVWAANHWKTAIEIHSKNHPDTIHSCQDLQQANFNDVPDCDIILGSPACQGHSRARGKEKPHHDSLRSTAWAIVSAVEAKLPEFFAVENVPEFMKWNLYPIWKMALEKLGYAISENILNASEFGVPQNRKRIFILGSKSKKALYLRSPNLKGRSAFEIIDWNSGNWKPISNLSMNTKIKIQNSRKSLGDRFLIAYYGSEKIGRSIQKPFGTITTKDRFAIVSGDQYRMVTIQEYKRIMGFDLSYNLTGIHSTDLVLLGNAVCPGVAKSICSTLQAL